MNTASDTANMTVTQAISAVMRQVLAVGKGDRNNQQGFNFRGIDAVLNAVGPALRNHGVVAVPTVIGKDIQTLDTYDKEGKPRKTRFAVLDVDYTFYGPAGDTVSARVAGEAMDFGDKVVSKSMSVAYRTALIQVFALPTQEADPDTYVYDISGTGADAEPEPTPEERAQGYLDQAGGDPELIEKVVSWAHRNYGEDHAATKLVETKLKEANAARAEKAPPQPAPEERDGPAMRVPAAMAAAEDGDEEKLYRLRAEAAEDGDGETVAAIDSLIDKHGGGSGGSVDTAAEQDDAKWKAKLDHFVQNGDVDRLDEMVTWAEENRGKNHQDTKLARKARQQARATKSVQPV